MIQLGDFDLGKTVWFFWPTNAAAGQSITRGTNGTIKVHINGGATVTTDGVTDTEDYLTLTGVHRCAIDMSVGTNYVASSECCAILETSTIDGKTINAPLAHWSIMNRTSAPTLSGKVVADAGNTESTFLTNLASTVDAFYANTWISFMSGALSAQMRQVSGYVGATKFLVLATPLTAVPADTDRFVLVNR